VIDVEVEKLVAGGDGMARPEGIAIFVPRAAPGDRLRVRLVERRPDYGRAEIVEVLAPGPGRRRPPCPYYERCGGCQLQHLEDDLQTRLKAEATLETLARLAGIELPEPPEVLTAGHWSYRLRTQLHTRRREPGPGGDAPGGGAASIGTAGGVEVGYFERGTNDLVPIEACPILVPELERLLPDLPAHLAEKTPRRLDLAAGGAAGTGTTRAADAVPARHAAPPPAADAGPAEITVAPVVPGLPHGEVELSLPLPDLGGTYAFAYDARCFFQAHRDLVVDLVTRAIGPWQGETACDLYAGVGLFTLPLARRYARVVAVEGDSIAARYARRNARRNRAPAVEVVVQAVETWIPHLPECLDRLLVDPPRGGLSRRVRDTLRERPPSRLTYVSCHAATLARDLRYLLDLYRLESLVLLDMFPQSGHMEAVVQLAREG
jgi:23S rRNA (uracil1939-C5)-methyltransferase